MDEAILEKTYNPKIVEEKWAPLWDTLASVGPLSERPAFSMVMPPPNVTGALHLGHALNSTLQDIIARYKRMTGFNVLWLPGIDHAGIATQNVVERQLREEGLSRQALGREKFLERVWQWKEASGSTIITQLKRLGATCDWGRLRFTLDASLSTAVREVFFRLYHEGLIYRGDYIINWCPRCSTALSDLEVQFEETDGSLYYMDYPLKGPFAGHKALTVATTRPETMFGDTAVAVNPEDERYSGLIGRTLILPLSGREIPVIADEAVSKEFGTGAVKITPAHDFNDFEVAKRHALKPIKIMNLDATMNENAGRFAGLDRFKARQEVVEGLKAEGRLNKIEPYRMTPGSCYRCQPIVEPTLSKQWFVRVDPLAGPAIEAVEKGGIGFVPRSWENTYFDWMRNIRDWCISRQLWWGHRIPAWHCGDCSFITVAASDPFECGGCGGKNIEQDPDVLDTWFSSALWPFSTLGWPDRTGDLKLFYPTDVLSTSFDIIFFWVARMIMMGLKFTDNVPFKTVYIHALIRDAEGQKMSKSKGNVIDPLVMMDKFGTDALRFTLAALAAQGRDIKISEERIEGNRNFCNKLWNLARFTLMNVSETAKEPPRDESLSMADRWIKNKRSACVGEVRAAIDGYEFDAGARALYRFIWHELCDWYVELIKDDLKGANGEARKIASEAVLIDMLKDALRMLHPFMPFITEEIFSTLPGASESLLKEEFPSTGGADESLPPLPMDDIIDIIRAIRNIRTEMNVALDAKVDCVFFSADEALLYAIRQGEDYIKKLAKAASVEGSANGERPRHAASAVACDGRAEVFVPLKGHIDIDAESKKIGKEMEKISKEFEALEAKLKNPSFVSKAPGAVVEETGKRLKAALEKKEKLKVLLDRINAMRG